jgi:hypothetical protein
MVRSYNQNRVARNTSVEDAGWGSVRKQCLKWQIAASSYWNNPSVTKSTFGGRIQPGGDVYFLRNGIDVSQKEKKCFLSPGL